MAKPPSLTELQRRQLAILEPALRNAATLGHYAEAKRLTAEIQALLRPTGHETRLMASKLWLFQAAMEADQLQIAESGFRGIRQKVGTTTRIHLEATALLAICYLRRREYATAEPLMAETLRNGANIASQLRRRQFRRRLIERFEEETLLYALRGDVPLTLDPFEVQQAAAKALRTKTQDEILADVGAAVPPQAIEALLRVHEFARAQLEPQHCAALPPAQNLTKRSELGGKVLGAAKRVIWKSLCDRESEVYRVWFTNGMAKALDGKLLGAAMASALSGFKLGTYALVVAASALVLKMGLEMFCELSVPEGILIPRNEHEHR